MTSPFFSIFANSSLRIHNKNITMNTNITEKDGEYTVFLEGELDTAHALEVEQAMQPLHELSGKNITIDCSKLEYIASSGLRILLGLLKSAKANENKVVLKNLNDEIKEIFKMTGFIDLFNIE
jgi:anti-anti-sigma factor